MRNLAVPFVVIMLAAYTAGCSFSASSKGSSNSSESSSDIVSSPFTSSSGSSSPEDAYREEVKDFTASYTVSRCSGCHPPGGFPSRSARVTAA